VLLPGTAARRGKSLSLDEIMTAFRFTTRKTKTVTTAVRTAG